MKGTISWLAAITLAAGLGAMAYGTAAAPQSAAYTAHGIAMTASCKDPNCGGNGKCPKGQCPKKAALPGCCK